MIIIEAYFDNRSFYRLGVVNIFREKKSTLSLKSLSGLSSACYKTTQTTGSVESAVFVMVLGSKYADL